MKKIAYLFLTTAILISCSGSSDVVIGNKTTIEFDSIFDGGKVVVGEEVKAEFKVKNTGSYPLIIAEVKGSCSCTVADYPKEPIAPGKSGLVKATVNTDNISPGQLRKEVRLVANTNPSISVMEIKAKVLRR